MAIDISMSCSWRGVKRTVEAQHRGTILTRFAQIELPYPIPHPLVTPISTLDAIPVLPARFRESKAGARLALSYEDVVRANGVRDPYIGRIGLIVVFRTCAISLGDPRAA
jgi:hypothetical protein